MAVKVNTDRGEGLQTFVRWVVVVKCPMTAPYQCLKQGTIPPQGVKFDNREGQNNLVRFKTVNSIAVASAFKLKEEDFNVRSDFVAITA